MPAKPLSSEQLEDAARLDRIFLARKEADPSLTQEALAHACGWKTQGSVNQYLKGKIPLNLPAILKFAHALGVQPHDISPSLAGMLGAGEDSRAGKKATLQKIVDSFSVKPVEGEFIQIRRVRLKLSAGITGFVTDEVLDDTRPITYRKEWFIAHGYTAEKLIAVDVGGKSMWPTIDDGDTAIVNTADTKLRSGKIYAVNFNGEAVIKTLVRQNGMWFLASDNPDKRTYPNQICSDGSCIIVGRVVQAIKEF
ncbi:MAG: HTH-type transcriptional regulator PrtR [Herbaspirillum frisingense]|uniref:HTH-type transcriptional regulator PrtR n=1 Tax=Herbaspirillum frisingense TaxID=92645 RepID=A0A7V8FVT0_9BURK|nr:MAG: HTH-type transcriptional regulator PrtR [Herbaspirillum frisingense]